MSQASPGLPTTVYGGGRCSKPDCNELIPMGQLMCRRHWFSVPKALRDFVWLHLRRWEREEISLGQLRAAQDKAIAAAGDAHVC